MPARLNPFSGMRVSLFDMCFSAIEVNKNITHRIEDLYNPGVIDGLTVFDTSTSDGFAAATSGTGYSGTGERIRVPALQDLIGYNSGALNAEAATYWITARYVQGNDGTSGLDVDGQSNFRHLIDSFNVLALKQGTDGLGDEDIRLAEVTITAPGASLIVDSNVRDTFSAKFSDSFDLTAVNLNVPGTLTAGTFSFTTVTATSNIRTDGDFYADTAGKGLIIVSPDGSKTGRVMLTNSGFLAIEPLDYSL